MLTPDDPDDVSDAVRADCEAADALGERLRGVADAVRDALAAEHHPPCPRCRSNLRDGRCCLCGWPEAAC